MCFCTQSYGYNLTSFANIVPTKMSRIEHKNTKFSPQRCNRNMAQQRRPETGRLKYYFKIRCNQNFARALDACRVKDFKLKQFNNIVYFYG